VYAAAELAEGVAKAVGETEVVAEVETEAFRQEVVNMEIKYLFRNVLE
jgi:hypothetical protein